jgi:hypothetical protein
VVVILDAYDLLWGSPLSKFFGKPHHIDDFLEIEKHLVATPAHGTFVLGLMSNQFEDEVSTNVLGCMKKLFFPNADDRIMARDLSLETEEESMESPSRPLCMGHYNVGLPADDRVKAMLERSDVKEYIRQKNVYDGMQEVRTNWMHDTCYFGSGMLPTVTTSRVPTTDEIVSHIAGIVMKDIMPKPLRKEVEATISKLLDQSIDEERTSRVRHADGTVTETKEKKTVMALVIEKGCIRLSLDTLRHAGKADVLFQCTQEVNEALFNCGGNDASKATMLFGDTEKDAPWVFRVMEARRLSAVEIKDRNVSTRVYNSGYYGPAMKAQATWFLSGVRGIKEERDELFSDNVPFFDVDVDIAAYHEQSHSRSLGLSKGDQEASPSNKVADTERYLAAYWKKQGHRMYVYPDCYDERNSKLNKDKWKRTHAERPQDFSMRAALREMQQHQETRTSVRPSYALCSIDTQVVSMGPNPIKKRKRAREDDDEFELARQTHDDHEWMMENDQMGFSDEESKSDAE